MKQRLTQFARDRRGATALLSAVTITMLVGFGALAVDTASFFFQKRRQQGATDPAAIAAAADPVHARAAALASLGANGMPEAALIKVETGSYVADPALAPAARFTPLADGAGNAVRLTLQRTTPLLLGRIFGPEPAQAASPEGGDTPVLGGSVAIRTVAVAAREQSASFAIGSRLASLNGGLLNGLLGGLLGTNISLSVMDYQALLSARVDMFAYMSRLASRLSLTGISYDQLLAMNVNGTDAIAALADTLPAGPGANALRGIAISLSSSRPPLHLGALLAPGPYGATAVGTMPPLRASASALDILSALAEIGNGQHQVQVSLDLGLPGIASASLQLAIGERPVNSAWVTIGDLGATIHTAQTRLLLSLSIGGGAAPLVNLPLYLELASATASLDAISCPAGDPATATVTLGVTPAVADAWIGAVSAADMTNFTTTPTPGPAKLLSLANLTVISGRAHVSIGNLSPTPLAFSPEDIAAPLAKTATTTDFTASLTSRLIGDLQLQATLVGLRLFVPPGVSQTLAATLANVASPIDQTVAGLLATLGVGLGQADAWVTGVRCGSAVLVN